MIYFYGDSFEGSSHKQKEDGCCQDYCMTLALDNNNLVIAAVADGVGSAKHSDIAARMAAEISVKTCANLITDSDTDYDFIEVIEAAFIQAESEIDKFSLAKGHPLSDYDTTLSLVIYDGINVTYGHCGDGGIIGLTDDGDYVKITTPQKSEGIYVIPLRAGKDTWIIDYAEGEFASVLLATDGVYDTFFPYLLKGQPVEVYVPLIRYFMDNNRLNIPEIDVAVAGQERLDFICSDACASITDDKTILVLVNGDIKPKEKPPEFYEEPDWEFLQLEWNKKAYPHLYKDE